MGQHACTSHNCSESFQEACAKAMKRAQIRMTKPRLKVIECLAEHDEPLAPRQIFEALKTETDADVDQVSVYRTLEMLLQLGLIHQLHPSGGFLRCHIAHEHDACHILLHCEKCQKASEAVVSQQLMHTFYDEVRKATRFSPSRHVFQLNGICANCLNRDYFETPAE